MEEEKPVSSAKRCPKCYTLNLKYDEQNNRFVCSNCGFTENIRMMGNFLKNIFKR